MKFNKYLPFALIYFFLNPVGLPFGLTWMALLSPFFYAWIVLKRKQEVLLPLLFLLSPFLFVHLLYADVDLAIYLRSLLNLVAVYVFCQAAYTFFKLAQKPEDVFKVILIVNSILCLLAVIFYFTPWSRFFWIQQNITDGVEHFRRLKLFTYEASYYAMLFVPVFAFYFLQYVFRQNKINRHILLFMLFLPLALSFSLSVIGIVFFSGIATFIAFFRRLAVKRRLFNILVSAFFIIVVLSVVLFLFYRDNAVFVRLANVFSGSDTSTQGRTSDAFMLARRILGQKDEYWGIGLGQLKVIGQTTIREHYQYGPDIPVAIPNAAAETLLIFGWFGFILRLAIEVFLFFYTKVWTNYYRLILFLFVFIYQFAGSFITNGAEYIIWILAFTNVFSQFDVKRVTVLSPKGFLQPA